VNTKKLSCCVGVPSRFRVAQLAEKNRP
jgi:hypothetical protein